MPSDKIDSHYDIVIIGAGPAGLNACLHAQLSAHRPSILLVDKTAPWERPMPCAEAVGRLGFTEAITPDPSWIRHNISSAAFHSPDGTAITFTDTNKGYILDRSKMQHDIADRCTEHGAHVRLNTAVKAISPVDGGFRSVFLSDGRTAKARVVIDASGPTSGFGKEEPIVWKAVDLEPAYFAILDNVEIPGDTVHIHVGKSIAPRGYAWVFPGEGGRANVGVLVGSDVRGTVNIRTLLESFIKTRFPQATVVRRFAGSIPCGYHKGPTAIEGIIKTGDAASTVNPVSRAGIVEALMSGGFAGDTALAMLGAQRASDIKKLCREYEKAWYEKRGRRHEKLSKVKNALASVPDADYNAAARSLAAIPQGRLNMATIFRLSLGRFPRLVWAMRHLM
jgi:digeranylgeranylglycerophospholipid reductase